MNIVTGIKILRKVDFLFRWLLRSIYIKNEIKVLRTKNNAEDDYIEAAYIINLERQPNRWKQFKKEANYQKVEGNKSLLEFCHRVSAVDGKNLTLDNFLYYEVEKTYNLKDQYYVDPDPKLLSIIKEKDIDVNMTPEEVAVALSHIKVWQRIVDEEKSYSLVLEDDVFFEKMFANQLNQVWQELPNRRDDGFKFDLLYLSYREVDRGAEKVYFSENLNRPIRGLWWLSGYVLSYSGAKKLLRELPVKGPVDLWMNHQFDKLDVYGTMNSIIYQRVDLESNNNYSILPVLSQIGVQSDKAHLILEQKKGKNPVFVIGLDYIGTNNLDSALSLLGYRCCNGKWGKLSNNIEQLIDRNEPLLFDAYINIKSVINNYKKLDKLYPEAVFILTTINLDNCVEKFYRYSTILSQYQTKADDVYKKHADEILEYFKGRNKKLLTINIYAENNWQTLCKFLGCDIPSHPFPQNDSSENFPDHLTQTPHKSIPIDFRAIKILEHDVHPWIIPFEKLSSFGVLFEKQHGSKIGSFKSILIDEFNSFNESQWTLLENSFPSNLAIFQRKNFILTGNQGFQMNLVKEKSKNRDYSSASIASVPSYQFGRFEVEMKPAKIDGVITAFFLHRNDPWQEVDIEIMGNDTTKILVNVYFNPGENGVKYNYGNRGTPMLIDLGFDASDNFHKYTIDWEPHELRWFVDEKLIHVRSTWEPTPIPQLHMNVHCSIWSSKSVALAGELYDFNLPTYSQVTKIGIHEWAAK
jgi:GR25 family glycosyltransferase involved in LPS biosynthesis